jgi:hypothetical protein
MCKRARTSFRFYHKKDCNAHKQGRAFFYYVFLIYLFLVELNQICDEGKHEGEEESVKFEPEPAELAAHLVGRSQSTPIGIALSASSCFY